VVFHFSGQYTNLPWLPLTDSHIEASMNNPWELKRDLKNMKAAIDTLPSQSSGPKAS
jgi:hypothetical protein